MKKLLFGSAILMAAVGSAHAQTNSAVVVSACGTPPVTYTAGQAYPQTQDTNGNACSAATVTPGGTQDINLKNVNGATVNVGAGAAGTGTQRVTTSTDSTIGTVTSVTSATVVQPTGTNLHAVLDTTSTTAVTQATGTNLHAVLDTTSTTAVTQATGTNLHAVLDTTSTTAVTQATASNLNATVVGTGTFATQAASTQSGTWTVQPGNTANTTPWLVQPSPGTANGWTISTVTAANSTNATNLKASAGTLGHVSGYNNSATLAWVSFYNTAGTPSCGTSIVWQVMIPANSTSGGGAIEDVPAGLNFGTGIGYCITTGIAGTGSVAASAYVVNFGYK